MNSTPSLFEHGAYARKLRHESHQLAGPRIRKPRDDCDVRLLWVKATCRTPGVRQVGPNQYDIAILVFAHVIAHQALSATVQSQRQLVFRVVMPFKRNSWGSRRLSTAIDVRSSMRTFSNADFKSLPAPQSPKLRG
jgi:hypothetical protein